MQTMPTKYRMVDKELVIAMARKGDLTAGAPVPEPVTHVEGVEASAA
jgi:hypothetical protein